jgi:pimeloyl-ACP methyl ester carboxylesterase
MYMKSVILLAALILTLTLCVSYQETFGQAAPATQPAARDRGAGARGGRGGGRGGPANYPPLGQPLADADKQEMQGGVDKLSAEIAQLKTTLKGALADRLADVEICLDAVKLPLTYGELLNLNQARTSLAMGEERAAQLAKGQTPWTTQDGPRGYYSKIDGSAQPFLFTMPVGYKPDDTKKQRLYIFCRGRTDSSLELAFINGNSNNWNSKPFEPGADRFILQPYGRYCNANRFAGEIDVLEAIDALKKEYNIDDNRIVLTGFSMGGASGWQFATHYSDLWAATSAGAGFTETRRFLNLRFDPVWYQLTLWHMYDSVDYAANLFNVPMIAYAGEIDPQKQASDAMLTAMDAEGIKQERIIGPNTQHMYEPGARKELMARLDELARIGRDPAPKQVRLTTWTLRYNHMFWVALDGLEKHWDRARADARIDNDAITVKTTNVTAMHLDFKAGLAPWQAGATPALTIDGDAITLPAVAADKSLNVPLMKSEGHWKIGSDDVSVTIAGGQVFKVLHKRPGLQGPIDDSFMDSFIFVRPTGQPLNDAVGKWTSSEADRAIQQWHAIFRGEPRVKKDTEITDADIASSNLVLFGDPSSNAILKRVTNQLGIQWTAQNVTAGSQTFSADTHVPVFIYPNPLNPAHYIVVNSGFTFHNQSNNDMQNSKLSDWVVVDTAEPGAPDTQEQNTVHIPAAIKAAGFFDESWMVKNENK